MNPKPTTVLRWFFFSGITTLGIIHHEGTVLAAQSERRFQDLQVTLQILQPQVLQLEPISLQVSVINPNHYCPVN